MANAWWHHEQPDKRRVVPYMYGSSVVGQRFIYIAHVPAANVADSLKPSWGTNIAASAYAGLKKLQLTADDTLGVRVLRSYWGQPVVGNYVELIVEAVKPTAR